MGTDHGILTSEFFEHMKSAPGYFLLKTFHRCLVCDKEVLFDKNPLQSHVRGHDLSLDEYYHQHYLAHQTSHTRHDDIYFPLTHVSTP